MITSQLSTKSQTTIPRAVRQTLGLKPGDAIAYRVEGDEVLIRRFEAIDADPFDNPFALFTEWTSEEDEAFNVLATR